MKRGAPNILLIITDQHRADHLGCYGNPIVRTPNIDSLADVGLRFDRFYVASPSCMPNRATLMTGRMPSLNGVRHNGISLSLDQTTFVDVLRAAGFETALIGKAHLQSISGKAITHGLPTVDPRFTAPPLGLGEARRPSHDAHAYAQELPDSWDEDETFDVALPFYGFDHVRLAVGHGDEITGHYRRWLVARGGDPAALIGRANALPTETKCPQAWRTRVPEELHSTSFVAEETLAFLDAHACASKPFFLQCSFPDPHHPFTPPGRYWDMYDPASIPPPPAFHHPDDQKPPHLAALHRERAAGRANPAGHTVSAVDEAQTRAAIALTYGSISMIDDAVGRVLARLRALGLDENTVVIFTSDHGDLMGDHQLLLKGALHYQGLIRVPCVWRDPVRGAGVVDALCGTIDLPTTILHRAGLAGANGMQGLDLLEVARGDLHRDALVIEDNPRRSYMDFPSNFGVRTLVTSRWRLTVYASVAWGELYDLDNDPLEFCNLWSDPAHAGLRGELVETLLRRMIDLSDTSPLATGHGP